jgi:FixJ family two-component response regulator
MLVVETIARIRREHFIKGKTIKEIARDLKVSRNTVRNPRSSRLRNPGQLRRAERYRQTPPLKGVKIGSR